MRHICASCVQAKIPFFNYDWKKEICDQFFVVGVSIGGIIAGNLLISPNKIGVAAGTKAKLSEYGITDFSKLLATQIFSVENIFTLKGLIFFVLGGFLVGFGTRYAGGCTSGHAILGLSTLQ